MSRKSRSVLLESAGEVNVFLRPISRQMSALLTVKLEFRPASSKAVLLADAIANNTKPSPQSATLRCKHRTRNLAFANLPIPLGEVTAVLLRCSVAG